ncbi:MAG TPA: SDR family oxidoreductase [Solirubrobacteraceae bacterium]|nr:SDR family oxidoreductase [Solirubrobacteraceae bacterium]
MDLGLHDRACVISGASRGIGRATALMLASEGASLLLVGRSRETLWLGPGGLADQTAQARGTGSEEVLKALAQRIPVGRLGTAQEIAAVIAFLCSMAASNVAGSAWSVDGGSVPSIL